MRRKYLAIGVALITLSAAAAVAILPQTGADLRGNLAFLPTELWSPSDNGQQPSGNSGGSPQNPTTDQQRDPFSFIDLPFDTAKIYVADFTDDTASDDPASEPVGGEGQTAKGAGPKSSDSDSAQGTTNDGDLFGSIMPGNGFATGGGGGGGGFTRLASTEDLTTNGGGGGGDGGDPNGNTDDPNGDDRPIIDTSQTETPPITVDEPASLSLLLVGALALFLVRRAKRRAIR